MNSKSGEPRSELNELVRAEEKRILNVIRDNVKGMDKLISDLLLLSRITQGQITISRVNMRQLVGSVIKETDFGIDKNIYEFLVDPLPEVRGDADLLRQVWINLLSNALKYSAPSKTKKIII